ncbi:MAG: hypothetical protein HZB38_16695 [Planctomycetes bacterium]|nr:hypothetical protein [Planctomycetota bacterium]
MERDVMDATERVGQIEMTVAAAPATPEAEQRWSQRADALLAWLLSEWEREQKREAA